jgi:putative protease
VIWPEKSEKWASLVRMILKQGGRNFVLNAPWQMAFFKDPKSLNLWAGPFCNIANPLTIKTLADLGFSGVIISPELSQEDIFQMPRHSPLPLGIVLSGNWPLCVSRILADGLKTDRAFLSPKGEGAWVRKYGGDTWVFPNWKLDITDKKDQLRKSGYTQFIHLNEPLPKGIKLKNRPGMWNWNLKLL